MSTEHSGISSFFNRFRHVAKRKGRKAAHGAFGFNRRSWVEQLEERRLLVSRVFLDFGDAYTTIPTSGPFAGFQTLPGITPAALATALIGTGAIPVPGVQTFTESFGAIAPGVTITPPYTFVSTGTLLNSVLNPTFVGADFLTLELAVSAQIQRALRAVRYPGHLIGQFKHFQFPAERFGKRFGFGSE